jgi:hypothetical protein
MFSFQSFKSVWYLLCRYVLFLLSDEAFIAFLRRIQYFRLSVDYYPLNWSNPQTFCEKINILKTGRLSGLHTKVADKVAVREFVAKKIGENYLVPLFGIFDTANDIDYSKLPNQFAIKANHGSGWNIICVDKNQLNWKKATKKLNYWLGLNAYYLSREQQYKKIRPKLIVEYLIDEEPNDYKFFCFEGIPKLIQVDYSRFTKHSRSIYDMDWNLTPYKIRYPQIPVTIPKPKGFQEMIVIARKLSADFQFCRVDLYNVDGKIYFGEITLFPGGGVEPFLKREHDLELGQFLKLGQ